MTNKDKTTEERLVDLNTNYSKIGRTLNLLFAILLLVEFVTPFPLKTAAYVLMASLYAALTILMIIAIKEVTNG